MKTTLHRFLKSNWLNTLLLILLLLSSTSIKATAYYAIANGNWNTNTTWSLSSGGVAVGVGIWPVAGDNVYISEGGSARSVTIPAAYAAACANIYMGGANNHAATLTFATSTSSLAVSGTAIVYGPTAGANRFINLNAGTMTITGNLELGNGQTGAQANRTCHVVITTGTATVSGNLVFNNIAGSSPAQTYIDMSGGAGTFNLAGAFTINNNSGTLASDGSATFNFNGSAAGQTIPMGVSQVVYYNLKTNNTSASGATLSAPIPTSGTGTISTTSGNKNVTGTGTLFLTELAVGYSIYKTDGSLLGIVNQISSNTTLALAANAPSTNSNIAFLKSPGITGNLSVESGTFNNGGFAITLASGKNFSLANGATFKLTGTSTMVSVSGGGTKTFGVTSTVIYDGNNQSVTAETYGNLAFNGSGTKTLAAGNTSVAGNWTDNTNVDALTNSSVTTFIGTTLKTISGFEETHFFDLVINGSGGVYLDNIGYVIHSITLTNGILDAGYYSIEITNNDPASVIGGSASSYIIGNLKVAIAAGVNSYNFPIGTAIAYAPVSIDFTAGTLAGILMTYTLDGDQADIVSSLFSPTRTVNRTWTFFIITGLEVANYDATFNWTAGDQDPGFDYSTAFVGKYNGSWSYPAVVTMAANSIQITGESGFSDFQVGNSCLITPTATISGDAVICAGGEATLRVDLTGTPNWSYTWSDGTNTGSVSGVTSSPSYLVVSTSSTKTYTITQVKDGTTCTAAGSGSATVSIGPVTNAPVVMGCFGSLTDIPVTVTNFNNIGAISMTMNYDKNVMTYDSYTDVYGLIDYVYSDETGSKGIVRFSGITETPFNLPDGTVLITLKFMYKGGTAAITWNDSDDTWCEYTAGPPDYTPYCDDNAAIYYVPGSISDGTVAAAFIAANLTPPVSTDVQLTDLSTGPITTWLWSFDRPADVLFTTGDEHSQNPVVQFTDGGLFTVTLTVYNAYCEKTAEKIAYICAGLPGVWDGPTSSDWDTGTNWDNHVVPTSLIDVLIPERPVLTHFYPLVTRDLTIGTDCKSITLTGLAELYVGGVFTVNPGKILDVKDNAKVYANGY